MQLPRRLVAPVVGVRSGRSRGRRPLQVKRASERPLPADGMRVLVERRWPPGLSKERVAADLWLRDAAPSDALVRACAKDPSRWSEFLDRYRTELATRADLVQLVDELRRRGPVTLLHTGGDVAHNSAAALREILDERGAKPAEEDRPPPKA
jgi:uncharacterized protein YeaO (DUF488 family)